MTLKMKLAPFLLLFLQQPLAVLVVATTAAPEEVTRSRNQQQQHRIHRHLSNRLIDDGSVVSEIERQLEVQTLTDFCSNLEPLETFVTGLFVERFELEDTFAFLTEENGLVCSCNAPDEESLDITCGALITVYFDTYSNVEYMHLELGSDGVFVPVNTERCEYRDRFSRKGQSYCEQFNFSNENPTIFDSCSIKDNFCPGDYPCEICEGGLTAAYESCFLGTAFTCDLNKSAGTLISQYYQENLFKIMPDEMVDCIADVTVPTSEEFCADLSDIETTITQAFEDYAESFEITPFECGCGIENNTFAVVCNTTYHSPALNETFQTDESMFFEEQNGYLSPKLMRWTAQRIDDPFDSVYSESYQFSFLQTELFFCIIDSCSTEFCELCSDGVTVANGCFTSATCGNSTIPGSFLFPYKDLKLAAMERCPPPTMTPVADTSTTTPPDSSMAPTVNPTESSASTMKCFLVVFSVTTAGIMMAVQNLF